MRVAVMPGSFDPFTLGHADILKRACNLFDYVYVGVLINKNKTSLFTPDERVMLINKVILSMNIKNAAAESFDGLLVEFARKKGACATVRGIRSIEDFSNEMHMADLNLKLYGEIETVCLYSKPEYASISSSAVREIGAFGGDISDFVSPTIRDEVKERTGQKNEKR